MTSRTIDEALGAHVFFKCENLQRMGAFKFRGAFNALSRFDAEQRRNGVVAFSSGNHAQAIALSARMLGIPATIVMPQDAPAAKMAATRGYGGKVVTYDRYTEDREQIGRDLAAQHGAHADPALRPPGRDRRAAHGSQGTVRRSRPARCGIHAARRRRPAVGHRARHTRAVAARDAVRCRAGSRQRRPAIVRSGAIVHIDTPRTIADGAQTQHLGNLTFPIIRRDVDDILTATDAELIDCMRFFATRMKIVVEPTGCSSFAAVRRMKRRAAGQARGHRDQRRQRRSRELLRPGVGTGMNVAAREHSVIRAASLLHVALSFAP